MSDPSSTPSPQEGAERAFDRSWDYHCGEYSCTWSFRHHRLFSAMRELMGLSQGDWPSLIFWLAYHDWEEVGELWGRWMRGDREGLCMAYMDSSTPGQEEMNHLSKEIMEDVGASLNLRKRDPDGERAEEEDGPKKSVGS